jgi:hypothetical protein
MPISSLSRCGPVLEHKSTLLQSRTSERETGAGAENGDTDGIATMMAAGVAREDTSDDRVQEMATRTDDTDTDETIATADMVLQRTKRSAGNITVVASAQGQDLGSVGGSEVAHRGTEETERETERDTGVMTEQRRHRHSNTTTKGRGYERY